MPKKSVAVYPGTFDPITLGHIDIIKRAARIFGRVIVAVARQPQKETLFTVKERMAMVQDAVSDMPNVSVESFDGLVVKYARSVGSRVMIRGLRMISDFEYEFQMALTNRKLDSSIETVFMMPNESYSYVSSKLIKEAAELGADLRMFVPAKVKTLLRKKLGRDARHTR
jgi:pantetheine-phosphate adenylyltransferase